MPRSRLAAWTAKSSSSSERLVLVVAAPVYGLPDIDDPIRVAAGIAMGAVAFVSIGVLLGSVLPSARAAQAIGLMLFFPSFLLGVGGPPPAVMAEPLREIAEKLPLALATDATREPWLGIGTGTEPLIAITAIALLASALPPVGQRSEATQHAHALVEDRGPQPPGYASTALTRRALAGSSGTLAKIEPT